MSLPIASYMLRSLGLGLMVAASATALAADADQVILKNGDRITGHVVTTGADTLSLATDAAGTIGIRRAAIDRVVLGAERAVTEIPGAAGAPVAGAEMLVRPAAPVIQAQPSVQAQPSAHCLVKAKPVPATWSFTLQGAPDKIVLGTQSEELFGGGLYATFCEGSRRNATTIAAAGSHARVYQRGAPSIQTDVADAEIEQQHFFHSPQGAAVFAVGDFFTNNSLGMAMQKSVGLGLLSPQYRYRALAYDFAADARYLNQHLDGFSPALNFAGIRLKEQMHLQGKLFTWNEQGWIMPVLNDAHALQAYASFGPSLALKPWLHLGLSEEESYLGNAPHPNRKNYFASALSLTIQGGSGIRSKGSK